MIIGFLIIYFIIAFFSAAIIKIVLEEDAKKNGTYYDVGDVACSVIGGMLWPMTIIGVIILFPYYGIEKLVRKIFYYFRNKKGEIG